MTQAGDRFAGQTLKDAWATVAAERLPPAISYVYPDGRTATVISAKDWIVRQSPPGGQWVVELAPGNQPSRKSSGGDWKIGLPILAVLVIAIVVVALVKGGSSTSKPAGGSTHMVTYVVGGTASSADLTFDAPGSQISQRAGMMLPAALSFTMSDDDKVYLSAQNNGSSGTVTCQIKVDGVAVATNSSQGAYVVVTCNL